MLKKKAGTGNILHKIRPYLLGFLHQNVKKTLIFPWGISRSDEKCTFLGSKKTLVFWDFLGIKHTNKVCYNQGNIVFLSLKLHHIQQVAECNISSVRGYQNKIDMR